MRHVRDPQTIARVRAGAAVIHVAVGRACGERGEVPIVELLVEPAGRSERARVLMGGGSTAVLIAALTRALAEIDALKAMAPPATAAPAPDEANPDVQVEEPALTAPTPIRSRYPELPAPRARRTAP